MQGHVQQHLIKGAVEERRVQRDYGFHSRDGEPGRRGDRVLFGDADVVHPVGEGLSERQEARRTQHGGRDRDDAWIATGDVDEFSAEHLGPAGTRPRCSRALCRTHGVQAIGLVGFGRSEPCALAGNAMYDHRCITVSGGAQCVLDRPDIVAVHRPHVLEPKGAKKIRS